MTAPESPLTIKPVPGFWTWLFTRDDSGDRGISNVLNWWLAFHAALALGLAVLSTTDAATLAKSVAVPGAAILVGLAFGWAGRSASLLQDKGFSKFLIEHGPQPEGYVYAFQLAILTVLLFIATAMVLVAGGTGLSLGSAYRDEFCNKTMLFAAGSIAVRESWGIIYFVNKLTIQYYRIREIELADGS